ncbi:MAG TPA: TolC family protein [Candidatus Acidoferrum sp.]|nr:TolC family protein [Candidatus Acidoferrum sp.]
MASALAFGGAFAKAQSTNSPVRVGEQGNAQQTSGQTTNYPIDLPTTLRLAGARNLDIQIAREHLTEAQANRQIVLEEFFPWVSAGVGYHRRDGVAQAVPPGTISDAHFQSYYPGATLSAQVTLGDALYKSLAAKQLVRASDQALEGQRQDSVLSAAQGYFDLARARALVDVVGQALKTSQDYQQQLHAAVASGIAFKGDEMRIQSQTEHYQIALRQVLEQQRVAAAGLARILHLDPRVELVPQETELLPLTLFETNVSTDRLVEQAFASRPELKQSQSLLSAARADQKGTVYGPLIPSVGAQAFGGGLGGGPDGRPSNFGPEGDYTVGVSWRLGPGGLFDPGRIKASKARAAAAELSQARLKDEVISQVVTAVARMQSLSEQIELTKRNLATASETLRLTRERKQYGVGIVLEDIQAQQDLTQARSEYFTSLAEYNKAQYALSKAVGGVPNETPSEPR